MCVAPGPYRATQGRDWGQFGDAGSMSGPVAGSFRLPGGRHVLGGSYCMPHQGGECSPRVALGLSSHGIGPF